MKQIVKKTAGLFTILSIPFSVFAQQSVEFQRSTVGQMLNESNIFEFLGSSEFRGAVIVLGIVTLVVWGFYFFSLLRMNANEEAIPGSTIVGPLVSFPAELFSRGSLGTHHFGPVTSRLVPTENNEEGEEPKGGRSKKHDYLER